MRADFSIPDGLLYFAGTNQTLCPTAVLEARERYSRDYESNPTQGMNRAWGGLWESQSAVATLVGARPEDLFLRANATAVLNALLLGIPLPPGGEILVGELEYGAVVNIVRLRCERDGAVMRTLKVPTTPLTARRVTPESLVDNVVSQLSPRTAMLVLSHAMGGTGVAIPIAAIARETRRRDIAFVVDGTHAVGALPVDFRDLEDVDYYGVGLYKWLLGPKGTAFGWVHPRHQQALRSIQGGWTTFESFEPMNAFGGGSRFQERFLLHGCQDFAPYLALKDLVAYWNRRTSEAIHRVRRERYRELKAAVDAVPDWLRVSPDDERCQGPMLVYRVPEPLQRDGAALTSRLFRKHRLQTTSVHLGESWCLVLSPHVYNSPEEISRVAEILASL